MKKILVTLLFLGVFIPSTVHASGVGEWVSSFASVKRFDVSIDAKTGSQTSWNADTGKSEGSENKRKGLCQFGFRWNYMVSKCEEVVVPEHGVLNEDGISVRCKVGYKLSVDSLHCTVVKIPSHAQLSGTGDDFQCDRDFKRVGDGCEKLLLPLNSHIGAGGNDFDCNTGFRKEGDRCVEALKPSNAKFFPNSDDWYCEAGYQRVDGSRQITDGRSDNSEEKNDECIPLRVPGNARTAEVGTYFYCELGYKLSGDGKSCEKVEVPLNGEANWIGGWNCAVGYKKVEGRCEKVELPTHAKFFSQGSDFYCEAGYQMQVDSGQCTVIKIPENGERDDASLDGWRCKQGFVKNIGRNSCDAFKLPEHGFWVGYNSWDCDAGYRKNLQNLSCDKVSIPEHAHASSSFDRWDCDQGYRKNYGENKCEGI